jgi:hypothetical protein
MILRASLNKHYLMLFHIGKQLFESFEILWII